MMLDLPSLICFDNKQSYGTLIVGKKYGIGSQTFGKKYDIIIMGSLGSSYYFTVEITCDMIAG